MRIRQSCSAHVRLREGAQRVQADPRLSWLLFRFRTSREVLDTIERLAWRYERARSLAERESNRRRRIRLAAILVVYEYQELPRT